ncbi:hypothetical protein K0J45_07420 [Shewanella alkalitolerans]|uniref:hypothetical protein n=1 Tax=Shewanella alkalitolerans TaxID=2864209 RepID=UPI001C65C1A4|nr:hypothetical protein [Shewanella alkalitolerans]QYJ99022.1 hypothetical protein K0J45_07420 [Shewanella alkalitolerans]
MTTNHSKQEQDAIQQQIRPDVDKDFSFKWLIILLALLGACILALYFMNFSGGWGNQADFGAFGDYVGGVLNPVLGFATVGLLIWSLKMQRDELSLSRQELALTRQELAETKEETALSREALQTQVTHIKTEAKLSELTRLLDRSQIKIEAMLAESFPLQSYTGSSGKLIHLAGTYSSILSYRLKELKQSERDALTKAALSSDYICFQIAQLECEIYLFAALSLKYYEINQSPEFAKAYLSDALEFLLSISFIKNEERNKNFVLKIKNILGDIVLTEIPLSQES